MADPDYTVTTDENGNIVAAPIETSYSAKREMAYPRVADQLDMLWHAMDADPALRIDPFYTTIKTIKDQYPKP